MCGEWAGGGREGRCSEVCPAEGIRLLAGSYTANKLCGLGKIVREDGTVTEGFFRCVRRAPLHTPLGWFRARVARCF